MRVVGSAPLSSTLGLTRQILASPRVTDCIPAEGLGQLQPYVASRVLSCAGRTCLMPTHMANTRPAFPSNVAWTENEHHPQPGP